MNKKEKRLALATALQSAAPDMVVVDTFAPVTQAKTQALIAQLAAVGVPKVRCVHCLMCCRPCVCRRP